MKQYIESTWRSAWHGRGLKTLVPLTVFSPFSEFFWTAPAPSVFSTLHQICKSFIAGTQAAPFERVPLSGSRRILHRVERTPKVIWKPYTLTPLLNFIGLFTLGFLCRAVLCIRHCGRNAQVLRECSRAELKKFGSKIWNAKTANWKLINRQTCRKQYRVNLMVTVRAQLVDYI